jgi:hypothetical protein
MCLLMSAFHSARRAHEFRYSRACARASGRGSVESRGTPRFPPPRKVGSLGALVTEFVLWDALGPGSGAPAPLLSPRDELARRRISR